MEIQTNHGNFVLTLEDFWVLPLDCPATLIPLYSDEPGRAMTEGAHVSCSINPAS